MKYEMPTSFTKIRVWIKDRDPIYMVFWGNMTLNFGSKEVLKMSQF